MRTWIFYIDKINAGLARVGQWSSVFLVLLISIDVLMRYLFDFTLIWILEVEIYLFAMIFLTGAAYAFQKDKHVRVDIIYTLLNKRQQAWVEILGGLVLLLPWCVLMVWVGINYTKMSWLIGEGSPQPGGLPALYTLKALLPLAFFFLGLQGVGQILRNVLILRSE